ncbi:MAG: ATP-grasp domain-containing protein [Paracoccaceae bacterium]
MKKRIGLVSQRNNNIPFVFEAASRLGVELIDIVAKGEAPQPPFPALVDRLELDFFDNPDGALADLKTWVNQGNQLDGIMTSREEAIVWTAKAAQSLKLPGLSVDAACAARDKSEMRRRLAAGKCNVPAFLDYRGPQDQDALDALPYPYVVKPKSAFGSAGVTLVSNDQERDVAMSHVAAMSRQQFGRYAPSQSHDGVLLEGFLDGAEYVAECFAVDGKQHVVSLGYKGNPRGPYFEETVYLAPTQLPQAVQDILVEEAAKGMAALGIDNGPGHCEMRLVDGVPYILEIGARVGGSGSCHYVVEESTGFDLFGAQMRLSLGETLSDVPERPKPIRFASNYIIPLSGSGRLEEVVGLEDVQNHPECQRLLRFIPNGSEIKPYPDFSGFIGFIFGTHATYEAGLAQFEWLDKVIHPIWAQDKVG